MALASVSAGDTLGVVALAGATPGDVVMVAGATVDTITTTTTAMKEIQLAAAIITEVTI